VKEVNQQSPIHSKSVERHTTDISQAERDFPLFRQTSHSRNKGDTLVWAEGAARIFLENDDG
jgi:hypothetical protein